MALTEGLLIDPAPYDVWTSIRSQLSLTDALLFEQEITVDQIGFERQVYIGVRTDGNSGSGTPADPFNGSTPDRFDALMQSFPNNIEIILLPGTYLTAGYHFNSNTGWSMKPGWKIRGCGIDVTTVKLSRSITPNNAYIVMLGVWNFIESIYYRNFLEVSDLTIDCNGPTLCPTPSTVATLHGIHLQGSHTRISRVRCINWMSSPSGGECFVIVAGGPYSSLDPIQPEIVNFIIEDCIVEWPYWIDLGGATCIQLGGGELGDGSQRFGVYGTIRGCYIDGAFPSGQSWAFALNAGAPYTPGRRPFNGLGFGSGVRVCL
jgi:hypothetical protein